MVARLFLNNKLLPYCGPFASFLVFNTIGVYHQHHMCEALAPHVRSISTTCAEHQHIYKKSKREGFIIIIINVVRRNNELIEGKVLSKC